MKTFLTIVICLTVGFVAGFLPAMLKKAEIKGELETCSAELEKTAEQLDIAENSRAALNDFIGAYEAAANKNYGIAQTRAISGFDSAEELAEMDVAPFDEIANRRDEIVSVLAKSDDTTEPKVRELLFSLYRGK